MKKYFSISAFALMATMSFGLISCGDDDDEPKSSIDTTPISFFSGDKKVIEGADTIASDNKFVAYGKGNTLTGYHVGQTTVTVNGKKKIDVTVNPMYTLYADPICNWECDINYVKNHQVQGKIDSKSDNTILAYDDAGGASLLAYNFENGKLKSVIAMVSTNHATTLTKHLLERFIMAPYYKGSETYYVGLDALDEDEATTAILMQVYNASYISVFYTSAQSTASSRSDSGHQPWLDEIEKMSRKLDIK